MKDLKVTKVNEFEFGKDRDGLWDEHLRAEVSVKIGNLVGEVILRTIDWGENKGEVEIRYRRGHETLHEAGIVFDETNLIAEYNTAKVEIEKKRLEMIRERKMKLWDSYWIHTIGISIPGGMVINVTPREDYLNGKGLVVNMTYKGVTTSLGSYTEHGKRFYSFDWDYKSRKYSILPNAIKKFTELVDADIATADYKVKEAAERKISIKKMLNHLQSTLGVSIYYTYAYRSSYNNRGQGYHVDEYYIQLNNQKVRVSYEKREGTYYIGSFSSLTLEKATQLINVF